jgi:hypothetical protein
MSGERPLPLPLRLLLNPFRYVTGSGFSLYPGLLKPPMALPAERFEVIGAKPQFRVSGKGLLVMKFDGWNVQALLLTNSRTRRHTWS